MDPLVPEDGLEGYSVHLGSCYEYHLRLAYLSFRYLSSRWERIDEPTLSFCRSSFPVSWFGLMTLTRILPFFSPSKKKTYLSRLSDFYLLPKKLPAFLNEERTP